MSSLNLGNWPVVKTEDSFTRNGGKTSINFEKYKNQLGNFYPPQKIFLDTNLLKTLKINDIKSGLGEMAHYYLVSDSRDWVFLKKTRE